jgi:hypothetical protein
VNYKIELADSATSHLPDLDVQFATVEAAEVMQILDGFIHDAAGCGCSAAAFRILLQCCSLAADRVLAADEQPAHGSESVH